MTARPRITYHLWQQVRDRSDLLRMAEANYSGYRPMSIDAIKIEQGREVIYFPAAGKKKNIIVAAEKKVEWTRFIRTITVCPSIEQRRDGRLL